MKIVIATTLFFISIFSIYPVFAEVQMNGTIFVTPTANLTVSQPITAQSVQLDNTGLTTRYVAGDSLHTYSFDRVTNTSSYSVYWTGISSSEIDFSVVTTGLSDVRTTTTSPQLGIVQIDGINTPYSWTNGINTILVNTGKTIQEFFIPSTGGAGSIGSGGGPLQVIPPTTQVNMTCDSGVYDPITSTCKFGSVNVTVQPTTITTQVNSPVYGSISIQCIGTNSLLIQSVDLGFNPLGISLGQIPIMIQCGTSIANTCPSGTIFTDGQCITSLVCPIASQTSNGICANQLVCPAGTMQQGSQCVTQPTCSDGTLPVNNQCQNTGIPISIPATPPTLCDITNPLSCIMPASSTESVSIVGITDASQIVTTKTSITKITNPQITSDQFTPILLIIGVSIAVIISILLLKHVKPKTRTKKEAKSGNDKTIKEFNKDVRRNKPEKKTKKK